MIHHQVDHFHSLWTALSPGWQAFSSPTPSNEAITWNSGGQLVHTHFDVLFYKGWFRLAQEHLKVLSEQLPSGHSQ